MYSTTGRAGYFMTSPFSESVMAFTGEVVFCCTEELLDCDSEVPYTATHIRTHLLFTVSWNEIRLLFFKVRLII